MLGYSDHHPGDICFYPRSQKINFCGLGITARIERVDYTDGEVRYRSSLDFEGVALTVALIKGVLYAAASTMDKFLPGILQTIARFLPLTYLGDAMRQVMVNGTQVAPLGIDLAILTGWLVVCLTIAARTFRWE